MNTTTKVFIILNLLLALGFAYMQMLTYATRENWKRRWNLDTKNLAAELQVANKATAIASQDRAIAEAATERANALIQSQEKDIRDKQSTIESKDATILSNEVQLKRKEEQIQAQIKQIESLNKTLAITEKRNSELNNIAAVARAVAFQLNVKLAELEDDFNNSQVELQRREESIARLQTDAKRKDARLALVRERYPKVWEEVNSDTPIRPDVIEGMVAAVHVNPQGQQDLIMITIGKNMDLEQNMEFIIYRGNKYVVKARVEKVLDDMAACRVIPESWNTRGFEAKQGDLAQNRLW